MKAHALCVAVVCAPVVLAACSGGLGVPSTASQADTAEAVVADLRPAFAGDLFVPPPPAELCNGVDDDLDGTIDEGCPRALSEPDERVTSVAVSSDRVGFTTRDGFYVQTGIDGDRVLVAAGAVEGQLAGDWAGYRVFPPEGGSPTLFAKNLVTGAVYEIPFPASYSFGGYSLSARWLAWSWNLDPSGDNYDVWVLDLIDGKQYTIAGDNADSEHPQLDGDRVHFLDERNRWPEDGWPYLKGKRFDFAVADLAPTMGGRRYLTERTEETGYVYQSIVGNGWLYFVERGKDFDRCELSRIDAASATSQRLAEPSGDTCEIAVAVSARWLVVLRSTDPLSSTLWLYDLSTYQSGVGLAEAVPITTYPTQIGQTVIAGNTLTWIDRRDGSWHQWAIDLSQYDSGEFHPEGQQ